VPRKITQPQRIKFWALFNAGHTIKEAASRAGFSHSYGKGLIREGRADNSTPASRPERFKDTAGGGPIPYDELSDVAKDCLEDFGRFRARYLGSMTRPWQEEAAHKVVDLLASEEDEYAVVNVPQGSGKTRLFSHDIPAWATARDRTLRGLLGSYGLSVSHALSANLRDTLSRTAPVHAREIMKRRGLAVDAETTMQADYGTFRPTADETGLWRREAFTVAQFGAVATADKEPTWAAFSYEAKFLSWRIDLGVWDDLMVLRMLRNADAIADLCGWWDTEGESRLDPGGLMMVVMQRLGANDISRYLLDKVKITEEIDGDGPEPEDGPRMYTPVIYKAHYDDRCHGEHGRDAVPYPAGCMLDPRRVTQAKINKAKVNGNYEVVMQQEDVDPASVLVPKEWINGGTIDGVDFAGCWDETRPVGKLPTFIPGGSFTVRYMTVDPSPTKWWSIQDWLYVLPNDGTEPLAGYRYLVDIHRAKMGANEFLDYSQAQDAYIGIAEDWVTRSKTSGHPISHLIMEKNAAQRWAMQYEFFRNWARTRGVQVLEHETTNNKTDPTFGVWNTLPAAYQYGRVRLPGDRATGARQTVWPLVAEVTTYPNGATDDCVMSEWFGEYNLQHLVRHRRPVSTIYTDMPSWVKKESVGAIA
jgi:hypothetical protein